MKFRLIRSKQDWEWYRKELDAKHKYSHDHEGDPERYPCAVSSVRYEPHIDRPYAFEHKFFYEDKNTCPSCEHVTYGWPAGVKENLVDPSPYDDD